MTLSNKLFGLLFAALVVVLSFATTESAQAQMPYTVCNNTTMPHTVCVFMNCGGGPVAVMPCPFILNPGQCFTWPIPAGCVVTGVTVNGIFYATPAVVPFCYGVAAPPPNQVCFTGGMPNVRIR